MSRFTPNLGFVYWTIHLATIMNRHRKQLNLSYMKHTVMITKAYSSSISSRKNVPRLQDRCISKQNPSIISSSSSFVNASHTWTNTAMQTTSVFTDCINHTSQTLPITGAHIKKNYKPRYTKLFNGSAYKYTKKYKFTKKLGYYTDDSVKMTTQYFHCLELVMVMRRGILVLKVTVLG